MLSAARRLTTVRAMASAPLFFLDEFALRQFNDKTYQGAPLSASGREREKRERRDRRQGGKHFRRRAPCADNYSRLKRGGQRERGGEKEGGEQWIERGDHVHKGLRHCAINFLGTP